MGSMASAICTIVSQTNDGEDSSGDKPPQRTESLKEFLAGMGADLKEIERVEQVYPMKISAHFRSLIREKDDPIWKQCIPRIEELQDFYNIPDPLSEARDTKVPGVIHRYPDRVLLIVSTKCAMYCRFCTRKRSVGRVVQTPMEQIFKGIDYIRSQPQIRDVLLSGGDPLLRTNRELDIILRELRSIPHVQIIRIGTRVPSVMPEKVTPRLVNILKKYHPIFMNIHFEHPWEINPESERALRLLANAGIPLGSQTVLLRGINDDPVVMKELMQRLVKNRVRPYYLYLCDLVKGVEHFRTSLESAFEVFHEIQGHTSGLCVPHLIIDSPGGGKIPILPPDYLLSMDDEKAQISNYKGEIYEYPHPRN
jgi:lysine 2,3-aminomutase